MSRSKPPRAPRAQDSTERQRLIECLSEEPQSARELSQQARMSEKDVYEHLIHVEKSLKLQGKRLLIEPASCQKCGFEFDRRGKFSRPSRCPECRNERITPPTYAIATDA